MGTTPRLSTGAILRILRNGTNGNEKAALQVLGVKGIDKKGPDNQNRYRIMISDGKRYFTACMLQVPLNHLVESGSLKENSIIRIARATVNITDKITGKMMITLSDLTVELSDCSKIGEPVQLPNAASSLNLMNNNNTAAAPSAPVIVPNAAAAAAATAPKAEGAPPPHAPAGTGVSLQSTKELPKAANRLSNGNTHAGATTTAVTTAPGNKQQGINKERIFPVAGINPYMNRWTILVRVANKGEIRKYTTKKGDGQLFTCDFCDKSGEIRATTFNQECERFYSLFEQGEVYYISRASLKPVNRSFNTLQSEYEMTFNKDTLIEAAGEGVGTDLPQAALNFVPLNAVTEREPGTFIDVIGVVKSISELQTLKGKSSSKEFTKREIALADETSIISVTLWGEQAETFNAPDYPVYAFKGVRLVDFNGRSLSCMNGSYILANPPIEEAFKLRAWWDGEGYKKTDFVELSTVRTAEFKTVAQMLSEGVGKRDTADYFTIKGVVNYIKHDNACYQMCPKDGCNKKVVESGNGTYRCTKCGQDYNEFKWTYMVSMEIADSTGAFWVNAFRTEAEYILKRNAQDFGELSTAEQDEIFNEVTLRELTFTIRASSGMFNDAQRVNFTCVKVAPFNAIEHSKRLMTNIETLFAQ